MYIPAAKRRRYLRRIFVSRSADRCDTCYLLLTYPETCLRIVPRARSSQRAHGPDGLVQITNRQLFTLLGVRSCASCRSSDPSRRQSCRGPCFYSPLNRGSDYNEPASEPRIPRLIVSHWSIDISFATTFRSRFLFLLSEYSDTLRG